MAPRKQNPIQDIADTVSAWLGGNRGTVNPQVQRVTRDLGTVAKTIDTYGTGGLGQAALRDVKNFQQGGSLPTNLAKTAAVNAAAAAVGAAAAKVAGKAVAATGIPARVANKVTGQQVMIHASPTRGLTQIDPRLGSRALPKEKVVYGFDPKAELFPTQAAALMPGQVHQKAARSGSLGSVYVVKTPRRAVRDRSLDVGESVLTSTAPAKVVKELPIPQGIGQIRTPQVEAYDVALRQAVQRSGGKLAKQNRVTRKTVKRK
jgi:hypothetical protein